MLLFFFPLSDVYIIFFCAVEQTFKTIRVVKVFLADRIIGMKVQFNGTVINTEQNTQAAAVL